MIATAKILRFTYPCPAQPYVGNFVELYVYDFTSFHR